MYKCRICGNVFNNIEDVIDCEQRCLHNNKKIVDNKRNDNPEQKTSQQNDRIKKLIEEKNLKLTQLDNNINNLKSLKNDLENQILEYNKKVKECMFEKLKIKQEIQNLESSINEINEINESESYYINGNKVSKEDFKKLLRAEINRRF